MVTRVEAALGEQPLRDRRAARRVCAFFCAPAVPADLTHGVNLERHVSGTAASAPLDLVAAPRSQGAPAPVVHDRAGPGSTRVARSTTSRSAATSAMVVVQRPAGSQPGRDLGDAVGRRTSPPQVDVAFQRQASRSGAVAGAVGRCWAS